MNTHKAICTHTHPHRLRDRPRNRERESVKERDVIAFVDTNANANLSDCSYCPTPLSAGSCTSKSYPCLHLHTLTHRQSSWQSNGVPCCPGLPLPLRGREPSSRTELQERLFIRRRLPVIGWFWQTSTGSAPLLFVREKKHSRKTTWNAHHWLPQRRGEERRGEERRGEEKEKEKEKERRGGQKGNAHVYIHKWISYRVWINTHSACHL